MQRDAVNSKQAAEIEAKTKQLKEMENSFNQKQTQFISQSKKLSKERDDALKIKIEADALSSGGSSKSQLRSITSMSYFTLLK